MLPADSKLKREKHYYQYFYQKNTRDKYGPAKRRKCTQL